MSLRRSASGGNLRSASPNISKSCSQKTGRNSARSSQGSDVSDFLYISPMKQNSKNAKGGNPRTKAVRKNDSNEIKPKMTQSYNLSYNGSISGKKSSKRPAWSMKQPVDDTPRSEVSSTSTFNLPTRPSIDDFLDFKDLSPDQYVSDKRKTDINTNSNRKSLLEFLSEDTPRTDVNNITNDDVNISNRRSTENIFLDDSLKSKNNVVDSLGYDKLIIEDLSDQTHDEMKSWSSGSNKYSTKKRTTSVSSRSSNNSKSITSSTLHNSKKSQQNNKSNSVLLNRNSAHFSGNVKVSKRPKNSNLLTEEKAAKIIQVWWHKTCIRNTAGRAAMERMMENKRLEIEKRLGEQHKQEYEKQVQEYEQVKQKEQKARIARQKVIDEMHNKRNARLKPTSKLKPQNKKTNTVKKTKQVPEIVEVTEDPRPNTSSSVGRKVDEIFELSSRGSNSSFSPRGTQSSPRLANDDEVASTLVLEKRPQGSRKTYDDLLNTLKELEDDPIEFRGSSSLRTTAYEDQNLTRTSLAYQRGHDVLSFDEKPSPNTLLSADKLKTIMSFLDEVEKVEDDVRSEVLSQSRDFYQTQKIPLGEEISPAKDSVIDSASQVASDISNAITAHKLEMDEKKRTVGMMKKALDQQKEFTTIQIREMDKEQKQQLSIQRQEYEATIQRHLSFIDQLIDDKKVLTQRCEDLVSKLKEMDQKYSTKIKQMTESHAVELRKQKEIADAAEKIRREKWIKEKTQEIKEMTVKGLEPDIQKLIAKHKAEIKKIKAMKQGEIFEADERVGRKYIQQIEDLRNELEKEKELAVRKERENARLRFEDQLREEENSYQQQRRRLYNEIEEEKERLNEQIQSIKKEYEEKRQLYESSSKQTLTSAIKDYEKQLTDLQRLHEVEIRNYKEQVDVEKQQWIENYMKKQDTHLLAKERELKEGVRDARDKEIEMVIARLEQETALNREESERAAENRIKRIRDKYENEMKELERSERSAHEKCTSMKERMEDIENECIQVKSNAKQKQQELDDLKKITDRFQEERGKVSDIIRQEFADRLVALEEESKRLRNELHEEKSRHRFDVERVTKDKEDEMDEVHKRVKKAIAKKEETTQLLRQQMLAAEKRAEHLEQLLAEQRKKILSK